MKIAELVYESLIGELVDPIKSVPNAFEAGSYCEARYQEMLEAYERVFERLGLEDEDEDVEIIKIRCWQSSGGYVWKCSNWQGT